MGRKKGVPHRSKLKVARNRREIARRYLHGESQAEIGAALGLTQPAISLELKKIHQAWLHDAVQDFWIAPRAFSCGGLGSDSDKTLFVRIVATELTSNISKNDDALGGF